MKTSKCLMGVLLSSVLLISSVFAGNALSQDVKDGFNKKGQLSIYSEIRILENMMAIQIETVQTVKWISQIMAANAVIVPGMSLV